MRVKGPGAGGRSAAVLEASVGHLRTHRGDHEVDLIVECDDGRVVALALGAGVVTLLAPPGALASRVDVARRWTR